MRLAIYQPDIPQNTGTLLRTAACFDLAVDIIGPAGFDMTDRALHRAGLDYLQHVSISRHVSWQAFLGQIQSRVVLATTAGDVSHHQFSYRDDDILLVGRESAGVPDHVHQAVGARIFIPIAPTLRSLNVAVAGSLVIAEALRQTRWSRTARCGQSPRSSIAN